jgi:transposase-like protein
MNQKARQDIRRKLKVLEYASEIGNVSRACRYYGVSRESYYQWKRAYEINGEEGLVNQTPSQDDHALRISEEVENRIVQLRKTFHYGPQKISSYLESHHNIKVSRTSCYNILLRHGLNRLIHPGTDRSVLTFSRSNTSTSGHHIRMNVSQISARDKAGNWVRKFQYTAIDKRTRIKIYKVFNNHTEINAVRFFNYVMKKLPSHTSVIETLNDREFQGWFHRHVEALSIKHVLIDTSTPDPERDKMSSSGTPVDEAYHQKAN